MIQVSGRERTRSAAAISISTIVSAVGVGAGVDVTGVGRTAAVGVGKNVSPQLTKPIIPIKMKINQPKRGKNGVDFMSVRLAIPGDNGKPLRGRDRDGVRDTPPQIPATFYRER